MKVINFFLGPKSLNLCFSSKSPGTCINNTSVMMFKKGSFEIGATVYPVAIKVRVILCYFYLLHVITLFINSKFEIMLV